MRRTGTVVLSNRRQILELAAKGRLPAMYSGREDVEDGGLLSYSVSYDDLFRRAAADEVIQ